jgi:hypothetical protein
MGMPDLGAFLASKYKGIANVRFSDGAWFWFCSSILAIFPISVYQR